MVLYAPCRIKQSSLDIPLSYSWRNARATNTIKNRFTTRARFIDSYADRDGYLNTHIYVCACRKLFTGNGVVGGWCTRAERIRLSSTGRGAGRKTRRFCRIGFVGHDDVRITTRFFIRQRATVCEIVFAASRNNTRSGTGRRQCPPGGPSGCSVREPRAVFFFYRGLNDSWSLCCHADWMKPIATENL